MTLIRELAESDDYIIVFGNSAEGAWTLETQLKSLKIDDLVRAGRILVIAGAGISSEYAHVTHEHFLPRILDYEENIQAQSFTDAIFAKKAKHYKFLFLNGRARPHRKYLYERFKRMNLLEHSLWTMLDSRPTISRQFSLKHNGINLMATTTPLQWLPAKYEVERYRAATVTPGPAERTFVKTELFNNTWGEIYLQAEPYCDTYFSLVTETIFDYPYSFRTEKMAKPLAIGHPWIVASNQGFYRDMRNLGFQTFDSLIDESFDSIDNSQERMDRIVAVVNDLCQQDLTSFMQASESICKYNQQHLQHLSSNIKSEFADKFFNFIEQHRP
jgi:hypothetical protein